MACVSRGRDLDIAFDPKLSSDLHVALTLGISTKARNFVTIRTESKRILNSKGIRVADKKTEINFRLALIAERGNSNVCMNY